MKNLFLSLSVLFLTSWNAQALKLILLSNHDNAGDHNQVLGIAAALENIASPKITTEDLNTKTISLKEIQAQVNNDLLQGKVIIIGAGEGGIHGITDLSPSPNLIICLTSHMFLKEFANPTLLNKVSFFALPSHATEEAKAIFGSKLIETTGVSHNRQANIVTQVYNKWEKQELPQNCSKYLGVILGGDAPTLTKDIQLFTEQDAVKLATFTAKMVANACVLVLNGPRTGKHDANKQEIKTVHRQGYSDRITELFQKELIAQGIKNMKVFDFQHDTKMPYNSFDLVIGAVKAKDGTIIVPGESTSMISEAIDTLPAKSVLIYEDSAMNEAHRAHVESELTAGRASILKNYCEIEVPSLNSSEPKAGAAKVIAEKLWQAASSSHFVNIIPFQS
ncbi:MAG: hypothetical protein JSR85_05140 [Proteobacteria bacterium]|nr:hypothetical protein [Pseudomonadota bacterium]